jgi:DUF4097 and DUF4098 domain-containing protein YvlB
VKDDIKRIIKLVQDGKLTAEEAAELITAIEDPQENQEGTAEESAAPGGSSDSAQQEKTEANSEAKQEDPMSKLLGNIENMAKDVARSVNWSEIATEVKKGVTKAVDVVRQAAEDAGKGKGSWTFFSSQVSKKVDLPLVIPDGKILRVEGVSGNIIVQGGAENPQILIEARFRAYNEEEAKQIAERYTPMLEESESHITLRHNETDHLQADVTAFVPVGIAVEIKSTTGDVKVVQTMAPVRVSTTSGDVKVSNATGSVDIHVNSGDISVSDSTPSLLTVESQSSDLTLSKIKGSANLRTSSGDISLNGWEGKTLSVEAASGDISLTLVEPVSGKVSVRTVSGEITIVAPEESDARVNLSTLRGHVRTDLTLKDDNREPTKVTGVLGKGKGAIDASAVNGDVSLLAPSAEATPATD